MTLSKPYDMLLSRNPHVSTSFKYKVCNHIAFKSQEWFLTTILLRHNKAVEHKHLHKVDGQLLVPLQCFARYLIGFEQLVSVVDSTHVLVVVSSTGWFCLALISVSPVRPVHTCKPPEYKNLETSRSCCIEKCPFRQCLITLQRSPEGFTSVPDVCRLEQHVPNFVVLFS